MTVGQFRRELQRLAPCSHSRYTFTTSTAAQFVIPFEFPSSRLSPLTLAWVLLSFMERHICKKGRSGNELISLSYVIGRASVYGVMVFGSSLRLPYLMAKIEAPRFSSGRGTYISTTWSNPDQYCDSKKERTVRHCLCRAL